MSINATRAALGAALKNAEPLARVVLSSSLEGLRKTFYAIDRVDTVKLSLETQQLDEHAADKLTQQLAELSGEPPPKHTIPTVYAVSGKGLAEGKIEDQKLLRAAVKQKLDENGDVVVALMPVDPDAPSPGDEPARVELVEAAKQFVAELDIPVMESMEALQDYLNALTTPHTASLEGLSETISMEKIGWFRRLMDPKEYNSKGTPSQQEAVRWLERAKIERYIWTDEDIKWVESRVGFALHHNLHRFLTTVGSVDKSWLRILEPGQMGSTTLSIRGTNVEIPHKCVVIDTWVADIGGNRFVTDLVLFYNNSLGKLGVKERGKPASLITNTLEGWVVDVSKETIEEGDKATSSNEGLLEIPVMESMEALQDYIAEQMDKKKLSNEGFWSALGWVAEKLRKKTELRDWYDRYKGDALKSMEFRTGQVKAKGFAYGIVSNPNNSVSPLPSDPSAALKAHCDEFLRFSAAVVKKIRQSPQTFANVPVNNKPYFSGYTIEIGMWKGAPEAVWFEQPNPFESRITEVRALSKEEAVKLAKTIVECSDRVYAFIDTVYERGGDWDDFTFNLTGDNHEYWLKLFSKHIWSFPVEPIHAMHRWIQASLETIEKGDKATPSNEGLLDILGKLGSFLSGNRREDPDKREGSLKGPSWNKDNEYIAAARKYVQQTYGNGAWVAKQRVRAEPVSSTGILEWLSKSASLPDNIPRVVVGMLDEFRRFSDQAKTLNQSYADDVMSVYLNILKSKEGAALLKEASAWMKAHPSPFQKIKSPPALPGNLTLSFDKESGVVTYNDPPKSSGQVRAVSKDEIGEVGNLILLCLNFIDTLNSKISSWPVPMYWDDLSRKYPEVYEHIDDVGDWSLSAPFTDDGSDTYLKYAGYIITCYLLDTAKALERWLHRSIV